MPRPTLMRSHHIDATTRSTEMLGDCAGTSGLSKDEVGTLIHFLSQGDTPGHAAKFVTWMQALPPA